MKIFTIGFTKKSAAAFFSTLKNAGVARLVDVRLNNTSQLAGFAKKDDLRYLLAEICGIGYLHLTQFAPTREMLDEYKKNKGDWEAYRSSFVALMKERAVENSISPATMDNACLLCSEEKPDHCHRRLIAEYLRDKWPGVSIEHLP